jgi:hypothetical protein
MQRTKHSPIRNQIDLTDPAQVRAWSRRLHISADALRAVVAKIGNSAAAVTKEIDLKRVRRLPCPPPAEEKLPPAIERG